MPSDVRGIVRETSRRVATHGVRGWWQELTDVYRLSVKHKLGLHEWDPRIVVRRRRGEIAIAQFSAPFASFTISIDMPDAILHREFDRWLREIREQHPSPVTNPGRGAFNAQFGRTKFKAWQGTKIIEMAHLLAWRAQLDLDVRKRLSDSTLGGWIGRYTPKDVNKTKTVLKDALRCLPALFAQLEHEETQQARDDQLIAARIKKQIARKPLLTIRGIAGNDA